MSIDFLLDKLGFSKSEIDLILSVNEGISAEERDVFIKELTTPSLYESAEKRLIARLMPDPDGLKILKVMLFASLYSFELYKEKGILDSVFIDTMKCFYRFTKETEKSVGKFSFDRSFWVGRQLSLTLFRIGELEYELYDDGKVKDVSLHVPSDADLSPDKIDESIANARRFLEKYFPDFKNQRFVMNSWLLSPELKDILPENSRIIEFQNRFDVVELKPSDSYKFWVYGSETVKPSDYSEDTTLCRGIKKLILSGKDFHEGFGILHR